MIPFQGEQAAVQTHQADRSSEGFRFRGVVSRFRGRLWFVTSGEDYGLAADVTDGLAPLISGVPAHAFNDVDLAVAIDAPRPPNEVTVPVVGEELGGCGICIKLGAVTVKRRFVDAVRSLPAYRDARWFTPNRTTDGAVWAVVNDTPIAFIAGVLRASEARTGAHR